MAPYFPLLPLPAFPLFSSHTQRWEVRRLLSGPYDGCGARISITAGAGGVDAMDWAEMVERMYIRCGAGVQQVWRVCAPVRYGGYSTEVKGV